MVLIVIFLIIAIITEKAIRTIRITVLVVILVFLRTNSSNDSNSNSNSSSTSNSRSNMFHLSGRKRAGCVFVAYRHLDLLPA